MTIKTTRNKKGATLIEMLMSIAIFAMVMGAMVTVFATSITAKRKIETVRSNYENAQVALNLISKSLRTSTVKDSGSDFVAIYDYSQNTCITYYFSGASLFKSTSGEDVKACSEHNSGGEAITESNLKYAEFDATKTDDDTRGKVTIVAKVCAKMSECDKENAIMQTTTSLRDYDTGDTN